jgi:DNA topoisomerase-1
MPCHVCPDRIQKKIERKKDQISKKELQARSKEEMKTVALGTSKINYMDPRITIAWCKRNEVPLEKVFNKSLLAKFNWAMTVEPKFIF